MMRRLGWLLLVCALAGLGVLGYGHLQGRRSASTYRSVPVERGRLTAIVTANGTLNAVVTVQVSSQVSGQIKELLADFNTPVRQGQVIARLDPEMFLARVAHARADVESAQAGVTNQQAQVERAEAEIETARAALAEARAQTAKSRVAAADSQRDLGRKQELARRQLIARSERDTAEATHDSAVTLTDAAQAREQSVAALIRAAEAQRRVAAAMLRAARADVRQKEALLEQALVDLDRTTIRAPVDGVVVARSVDVGQTVATSLQAPTLFTIAQDLTRMQVDTSVAEADIGQISLGTAATFTVDAFATETFRGRVSQIRKAAQTVMNVVTYTAVVDVPNPGGRLLPGMTAQVKLIAAERADVLKVPNTALRYRPSTTAARTETPPSALPRAVAGSDASSGSAADRLAQRLGLSEAQRARVAPILDESREQRRVLRRAALSDAESRTRSTKIRDEARARIREALTPEQRARYDEPVAPVADRGVPGRVWVVDAAGTLHAVEVVLGLSDGTVTEVLGGDLKEGHQVLVGARGPRSAPGRPAGVGGRS